MGKTEVAKALAAATGARLIRLQCHEGIDVHQALYDWDYPRQLLALRAAEGGERAASSSAALPAAPPAARGPRARRARRAADRRGRPRRRRVRGVPARAALGLSGDDPGARHGCGRAAGRWSCSPPTARASCTTRSSAAASTTGSTTRRASARRRSCARGCPACRRRSPRACARRSRGCASEELYKLPGVGETIAWAQALLALGDGASSTRRSASALKVREDIERVRERGVLEGV